MYKIVKFVAVSFRSGSVLLTEGTILDPVMRPGVNPLILTGGPDFRVGGWGATFLQNYCFYPVHREHVTIRECLPEVKRLSTAGQAIPNTLCRPVSQIFLSYTGLNINTELPATTALAPLIAATVHVGSYTVFNVDLKLLTSGEIFQLVYKY